MKSKFACILLVLVSAIAYGQKPKQYVKLGDKAREKGNWPTAYAYYEEAFLLDSTDFNLSLHYAEAARQIKSFELAERLYDKLYEKDRGRVFPDGLFWLAMMQKHNGKYEDAQRNFKKYAKKHKTKGDKKLLERAEQEVKSAVWAMEYKAPEKFTSGLLQPFMHGDVLLGCHDYFRLLPVTGALNGNTSEVAPFLWDGKLYYSVFQSDSASFQWKEIFSPVDIPFWDIKDLSEKDSIHSNLIHVVFSDEKAEIANMCISRLSLIAYYSRITENGTEIWISDFDESSLYNARPLANINAEKFKTTMPWETKIGEDQMLFFASDRSGGYGGMDIWYSRFENGDWSVPKNAGEVVNTPGDEITPSFFEGALYFSSDWHYGFGGFDIFSAQKLNDVFDKPINLGKPINSNQNDLYFSIQHGELNQIIMFFASNREGSVGSEDGMYCCNDIYAGQLETICVDSFKVSELDNLMSSLPVRLYFHNDEPNPDSWDTTTTLPYSSAYESYMEKIPTYLSENSKGLTGEKQEEAETIAQDFFDLMVKKGMNDLQTFSDLLLKELEQGKRIRISVRGFASPRAQTDYNVNLTKRRIGSLINYLNEEKGGAFAPFINATATNGGKLEFVQLPFGEYKADKSVSDDLFNEKQSIYSRAACLERKIEIESVSIIPEEPKAVIEMQEAYDFGKILSSEPAEHIFEIRNTGTAPLQVDSLRASCGCTTPSLDKSFILPGETAQLKAGFDPLRKKGQQVIEVYLFIHGEPEPRIITIMADVE